MMTSGEELLDAQAAFVKWDSNQDGLLSRDEIEMHLTEICEHFRMEPPDVQKMLNAADFDQSGKLSYPEFVAAAFDKKKLLTEENLRKAFTLFDPEGKGYFERARLEEMFCGKMSKANLDPKDEVKLASDMIRSFG